MVKVAILRRAPGASFSMDVCADGLIRGLRAVRPSWEIVELRPEGGGKRTRSLIAGLQKYYRRYWQYPRRARRCDADLFHVIDHSDGHLVRWLSQTCQPTVVTCHDLINFFQPDNIRDQASLASVSTAIWKYSVRGVCQADWVVTVSKHTALDVTKWLNVEPARITPVPNGVDAAFQPLNEASSAIRARYDLPADKLCLIHVGSNHPRKNILTVLAVLKSLKDRGLSVHLIKAGASFSQAQTDFIELHSLEDAIAHFDQPNQTTLVDLYNAADVLLSPSLYEGFGITLLEAMACGTPVVTSNVTSLPEVVGDAGIMASPLDVDELAMGIQRLHNNDRYRRELIQSGLLRVKDFTWECSAEQVAQVYEKLLDL